MSEPNQRIGQSVRTVLDGLILAGVLWLASSIQSQSASIVKLQVQVQAVQMTLMDVPSIGTRVTRLEVNQADLLRRRDADDQAAHDPDLSKWTRHKSG